MMTPEMRERVKQANTLLDRILALPDDRIHPRVKRMVEEIDIGRWADRRTDDELIVIGDWNPIDDGWDAATGKRRVLSTIPRKLEKMFAFLGFTTEWQDSVVRCDGCGGFIPTQPAHMFDEGEIYLVDGDVLCPACADEAAEEVIEYAAESRGAVILQSDFARKHLARSAEWRAVGVRGTDAKKIAKEARALGLVGTVLSLPFSEPGVPDDWPIKLLMWVPIDQWDKVEKHPEVFPYQGEME